MGKAIEAAIQRPDGTKIVLKGAREEIEKVVGLFAGGPMGRYQPTGSRGSMGGGNLDSVAELDEDGKVHVVAPDLKALSAIDAAKRLLYVGLLARRELLNERKSLRADIVNLLKNWNLYDGNVRKMIPSDRGVIKEGRKYLSLSSAAIPIAWEWVREIQDPNTKGRWTLTGSKRRRGRSKK